MKKNQENSQSVIYVYSAYKPWSLKIDKFEKPEGFDVFL